jgi:hypothetical protein
MDKSVSTLARLRIVAAATALLLGIWAFSSPASAATITVNSLGDPGGPSATGSCVLRDAITASNTGMPQNGCLAGSAPDTIQFSVTGTIALASTLPTVTGSLTITGPTAAPGITIDGGGLSRMTQVASAATLKLQFLTVANGFVSDFVAQGGAIFINSTGTLTVTNCTFLGNRSIGVPGTEQGTQAFGGAVYNNGTLIVTNSTFSGNVAQGDSGLSDSVTDSEGGAIENDGTLTVANSTFSGNRAELDGAGSGAIDNFGTMSVTNSTFSGNKAGAVNNRGTLVATNCTFMGNFGSDIGFPFPNFALQNGNTATVKSSILAGNLDGNCNPFPITDAGYNISDDGSCAFTLPTSMHEASGLDTGLKDNGGPTQTIALLAGSPAIDAIPFASCTDQASPTPNRLTTDQRGNPRPDPEDGASGPCDIGAYEFAPPLCTGAHASQPSISTARNSKLVAEMVEGVSSVTVTSVFQDEPVATDGTCPDAITGPLQVRAERDNSGNGRVYHVRFTGIDSTTHASCGGEVKICVPHDSAHRTCGDGGALFDSTLCH